MSSLIKKSRNVSNSSVRKFSSQPNVANYSSSNLLLKQVSQSASVNSTQNSTNFKKNFFKENERSESDINNTPTQKESLNYVVLLPYLMDETFLPIKQPFLFQLDEKILIESDFSIPFTSYFETQKNNFTIRFSGEQFNAQIMAMGQSIQEVKNCLKKNMKLNPLWSNIRKVVGKLNERSILTHSPLDVDEAPIHSIIGKKKFENLITSTKTCTDAVRRVSDSRLNESDNSSESQDLSSHSNIDTESSVGIGKKSATKKKDFDEITERDNFLKETALKNDNHSLTLITLESLQTKIQDLQRRTAVLSDSDILASTLKVTIETVCSLFSHMHQEKIQSSTIYKVAIEDETYKVKKQDKIFLEGLVELNLSKYQTAIGRAKPRNPCAFAYQLVSIAFPSSYCDNVWLGKKYYDEKEISVFFEQSKNKGAKFPLLFIWSFKDPFNEPIVGDFDIFLGQKRVRAFTDHIFRKSGIFEYDEELESKVRTRLSKVLCSKNRRNISEDPKNAVEKEKNQRFGGESSGSIFVKKRKSEDSEDFEDADLWDTECFD